MAKGKITKDTVDSIPLPAEGKREHLWDEAVKGFGVMVTDKGVRSYILQYRMGGRGTPTRRVTLGRHGSPWTPASARKRALELLEQVRRRVDPFEAARETLAAAKEAKEAEAAAQAIHSKLAFEGIAAEYIAKGTWADGKRIRTWASYERIIQRDLLPEFGTKPLSQITSDDINELLHEIGKRGTSAARRAHIVLTNIFKFAAKAHPRHLKSSLSPMHDVHPPSQSAKRDRHLSDEELRLVWISAERMEWPWRDIIRLLILTGARLREVAHVPWSELNISERTWIITGDRTKNGDAHLLPMTGAALAIWTELPRVANADDLVFPSSVGTTLSAFSKMKQRLDGLMLEIVSQEAVTAGLTDTSLSIEPWRLHDLRRTVASGCQRLGIPLEVSEAILNHTSGTRAGIAGVYHVYKFENEKRAALDSWAKHVIAVVSASPPMVSATPQEQQA